MRSQGLVSAVRSGTGFIQRHTNRTIASIRMVMPKDLCHPSVCSFASPLSSSARSAITHWLMMRITMIQCSALVREPHDWLVLRKVMPVS